MGFSYGYNRAERLEHYHTGRELVTILVDTVSRGGNLLLDIGPAADGTIPVVMEERLAQIGAWLAVNGEAIYGTKPFSTAKQWSEGEQPRVDYNQEYNADYDVSKLTQAQPPGRASIEAFLRSEGRGGEGRQGREPPRLGRAADVRPEGRDRRRRASRPARGSARSAGLGAEDLALAPRVPFAHGRREAGTDGSPPRRSVPASACRAPAPRLAARRSRTPRGRPCAGRRGASPCPRAAAARTS
jgi:hypothetical protein